MQMMCVLESWSYGLYDIDENSSKIQCHWEVKVASICNKGQFISWFNFVYVVAFFYHIKVKSLI